MREGLSPSALSLCVALSCSLLPSLSLPSFLPLFLFRRLPRGSRRHSEPSPPPKASDAHMAAAVRAMAVLPRRSRLAPDVFAALHRTVRGFGTATTGGQLKVGSVVLAEDGSLVRVTKARHVKPGKGGACVVGGRSARLRAARCAHLPPRSFNSVEFVNVATGKKAVAKTVRPHPSRSPAAQPNLPAPSHRTPVSHVRGSCLFPPHRTLGYGAG